MESLRHPFLMLLLSSQPQLRTFVILLVPEGFTVIPISRKGYIAPLLSPFSERFNFNGGETRDECPNSVTHRNKQMATKLLWPPLLSHPLPQKFEVGESTNHQLWLGGHKCVRTKRLAVRVSLHDSLASSVSTAADMVHHHHHHHHHLLHLQHLPLFSLAESVGYSLASYYTSLGLFVISVPGLWSLIKRSVKSKIVQKTYISEGGGKKAPNQIAGEILSYFSRNNFVVSDRGETITFEGMMIPSRGQAALLTFCTCISLASVALVLTITVPEVGDKWYSLTILSPLAGAYYWKRASRKEQIKVKMMVDDKGTLSEILVQGDDQQVEQMRKELQLSEKGMVYVKGIFERS
ncbi:protein COFACTOR ASSEMBLY OF COMPLEX C SUBUNIT B CCB1, chloroplastic isoform X1 [Macadamia integrifolia]|uniref:protein COFACTOR ASSEMBLY OF COMPLEX C SUBUNIT B CCB1, chloroplastic isoform X1 n=1 Tax=Macadamia integrifolia TaxID=60698 RepID=UPI001C4E8ACF|nr:protein COFACTOR ASSEMBLY OF COMPLEX C SUBUNIT B CCB1, chloroplastic isoform X1 [Macadamia integrifolia]